MHINSQREAGLATVSKAGYEAVCALVSVRITLMVMIIKNSIY